MTDSTTTTTEDKNMRFRNKKNSPTADADSLITNTVGGGGTSSAAGAEGHTHAPAAGSATITHDADFPAAGGSAAGNYAAAGDGLSSPVPAAATGAAASSTAAPSATDDDLLDLGLTSQEHADYALDVVADEPDLRSRLSAALATGAFQVPALIDLPNRHRIAALEEALDAFALKCMGGPCDACGSVLAIKGRHGAGYLDATEPGFHECQRSDGLQTLCAWCHDFLAEGNTADDLREFVGCAIGGVMGKPGPGFTYRFAHEGFVPFAHTVGAAGRPWAHVTANPTLVAAIAAQVVRSVSPKRLIRTQGAAERAAVPGVTVPIHGAFKRPPSAPVTVIRPEGITPKEEEALMERFHEAERAVYMAEHPRLDETGAAIWTDDHVAGWADLLASQERERRVPSIWRNRTAGMEPPTMQRPAYVPPTITRRHEAPEALLESRQASERAQYLDAHPTPAKTGQPDGTPWGGLAGWEELLARHDSERRAAAAGMSAAQAEMEQRHAEARAAFLRDNPRPRPVAAPDTAEWKAADEWSALLAAQEQERKSLGRSTAATNHDRRTRWSLPYVPTTATSRSVPRPTTSASCS